MVIGPSDWQNRTTAKRESYLLITSITDRIGRQKVLLSINHNHFNFRKKHIHLEQISPVETSLVILHFGNSPAFCFWISGYCDQCCDWWIKLSGPCMSDCFKCPITGVQLQPTVRLHCPIALSDYNCSEWLVKNEAANAPITFEE